MDADGANSLASFGFLTVLEDTDHGLFGGYLVLGEQGRPQEFHCTTPVLPTQAQQILYGPTLKPYLMGEVIGQSLVDKSQLAVQVVLTDVEEVLSLALVHKGRVACVAERVGSDTVENLGGGIIENRVALEHEPRPEICLGEYRLIGEATCSWDVQTMQNLLAPLVAHVDLAEPFQRIREAIREAQRITHLAVEEDHDHSAAA